ncbi:precorrin-2 C(20)-methyltransferase [Chitinophaga flava]|uniref:Precorrin-2 C(20)-methyltransferase n=1 Tax=Chitinophaga flava TaxID=2259036 RepID=A0A365XY76_9BACT|nr:precorrin-2 C(20)-methyltransferase [Chitinophaga flava]RBL91326.1 precorrin-2 C(20)-methyltransferase [Chitinophaga flava]
MNRTGKIYAVSLGPGDPDLITLKGWKALQQADKIYYPASLQQGQPRSYARTILDHYQLENKTWQPMLLEMSNDRSYNLQVYTETAAQMKTDVQQGLQVAFVSEGDISFYSTFIYLLEHIRRENLPLEVIAGVPAFLLAAAAHQQPLALLREKIAIIPLLENATVLEEHLRRFETIVLIKVRGAMAYITPFLENSQATMLYGEKLGTAEQYLATGIEELQERTLPYFSLIILKSNICN